MTAEKKHTIVLDVMGSDTSELNIITGGVEAARCLENSMELILVGKQDKINAALATFSDLPSNISVQHAESVVPMKISATEGVKMRDSSISVGLKLLKTKKAQGFVSPGNTGAVMATALLTLGRIEGVSRPAITAIFPTSTGRQSVILDVGANTECKPHHISQFAVMGSVYYSIVFKHENPRVGLISIGEERSKGNELIFNSRELLKDSNINFIGNIEGRDILNGAVDVAVTDGFTGNILLKFAESIKPLLVSSIQKQIQTNIFSRMGVMLLLPFMKRMKNMFAYERWGGAPLLGVDGNVIICHGSSNPTAIRNAIKVAYEMTAKGIRQRIHDELITNHFGQSNGSKKKSQNNRDGIVCTSSSDDER